VWRGQLARHKYLTIWHATFRLQRAVRRHLLKDKGLKVPKVERQYHSQNVQSGAAHGLRERLDVDAEAMNMVEQASSDGEDQREEEEDDEGLVLGLEQDNLQEEACPEEDGDGFGAMDLGALAKEPLIFDA